MKLHFLYGDGVLNLPLALLPKLNGATKKDICVLLALAGAAPGACDAAGAMAAVATSLSLTAAEVESAVAFWRGAGILSLDDGVMPAAAAVAASVTAEPAEKSAKKPVADRALPHYTLGELSDIIESRSEFASLVDACQQTFGKIFNTAEVGIIAGLVDYLGVDGEYVLLLLSHCHRMEKKSLRYAEKLAISLYDEGVTETAALEERLHRIEIMSSAIGNIRTIFGLASRALTTKEKGMVEKWICTMKYGEDIIKKAYETTVDAIGKPSLAYANTVLERWHAAGYRTVAEVDAALADYRREKAGAGSSFDADDFFEAALKQTYGEK